MRQELQRYIDQGLDDDEILATFVDRYGKAVRSAPPTSDWFSLAAWAMPFVALVAGSGIVICLLRIWKPATTQNLASTVDAKKYQATIEEELGKFVPED